MASAGITAKVERIRALADQHGVPIKAAALQFILAHPATVAVIPGASNPSRITPHLPRRYRTTSGTTCATRTWWPPTPPFLSTTTVRRGQKIA
jgi:hypothetical protein